MNDCVETQLIPTRYGDIAVKAGSEDLIVNFLHHYGEWAGLAMWLEVTADWHGDRPTWP